MNSSVFLFLLLMIANPAIAAGNSNGDEPIVCPKARVSTQATTQENDSVSAASTVPARPTPIRSTRNTAPRTVSPRWHSMLPGMFR